MNKKIFALFGALACAFSVAFAPMSQNNNNFIENENLQVLKTEEEDLKSVQNAKSTKNGFAWLECKSSLVAISRNNCEFLYFNNFPTFAYFSFNFSDEDLILFNCNANTEYLTYSPINCSYISSYANKNIITMSRFGFNSNIFFCLTKDNFYSIDDSYSLTSQTFNQDLNLIINAYVLCYNGSVFTGDIVEYYNSLNSDYNSLVNDYNTLESKYNALNTQFNNLTSSYNALNENYNTLESKYNELENNYTDLSLDYSQLNYEYEKLQKSYNNLLSEYNSLKSEYDKLTKVNALNGITFKMSNYNLSTGALDKSINGLFSNLFTYSSSEYSYSLSFNDVYNFALTNGFTTEDLTKHLIYIDLDFGDNFTLTKDTPLSYYHLQHLATGSSFLDSSYNVVQINKYGQCYFDNLTFRYMRLSFAYNTNYSSLVAFSDFKIGDYVNTYYSNGYADASKKYEDKISSLNIQMEGLQNEIISLNNTIQAKQETITSLQNQLDILNNNGSYTFNDLMWGIATTPFGVLSSVFNVNILGVNVWLVVSGLVSALLIVWLIKKLM